MNLIEVNEDNWIHALNIQVHEDQKKYVASSSGILARAYAFRESRARALLIESEKNFVGLMMIRDLDEEPKCYELQQLMIDRNHQRKGHGYQAIRMILTQLKEERKYSRVDVCVDKEDKGAISLYEKIGFIDTGYIADDVPNSLNLTYEFPKKDNSI